MANNSEDGKGGDSSGGRPTYLRAVSITVDKYVTLNKL